MRREGRSGDVREGGKGGVVMLQGVLKQCY